MEEMEEVTGKGEGAREEQVGAREVVGEEVKEEMVVRVVVACRKGFEWAAGIQSPLR